MTKTYEDKALVRSLRGKRSRLTIAGIAVACIASAALYVGDPWSDVPQGPVTTAAVTGGGAVMALAVPPGPYFLGELLSVGVTLANHSRAAINLGGTSVPSPCGAALAVGVTGGSGPHFTLNIDMAPSCPPSMTTVAPGRTLTVHQLVPLTSSGAVTLVAGAQFLAVNKMAGGGQSITDGHGPLGGRWPSLRLRVAATVPPHRAVALLHLGPVVVIMAPLHSRPHLVYLYNVTCGGGGGTMGTTGSGNFGWEPVPSGVIYDPGCPGTNERWWVSVSAPGYAIASGTYSGRGDGKV